MSEFDFDRSEEDDPGAGRSGTEWPGAGSFPSNRTAEWVDVRLEAYLDGDISPEERRRLESYVAAHPEGADQLRLARMVRHELGAIESPSCPPEVTAAVMAQARAEAARRRASIRSRFEELWAAFLRPTLAAASLAAIVIAGALVGGTPPHPTEQPAVNSAEVERALKETKWALAFVTEVSREAGQSIRRDVLEERVTQPIRKALGSAFDEEPKS